MRLVLYMTPVLAGDEEADKGIGMNLAGSSYTAQGGVRSRLLQA
jgi:hypothetical protein